MHKYYYTTKCCNLQGVGVTQVMKQQDGRRERKGECCTQKERINTVIIIIMNKQTKSNNIYE